MSVFLPAVQAQTHKQVEVSGRSILATKTANAAAMRVQGLSDNQRLLGYVPGDSITVGGAAFGTAGTYSLGAILTPQMLSAYAGCRVVGIRVAASMELGRARTFIYTVDKSLTAVIEQKQRLYEGWNNVLFNGDGYEIQGTETLFFGFDYTETAEMVAADKGGLCGYGEDVDGGFYAYGNFGSGLGLYSLSNIGCLCVQLIVDVSSLPRHDLDLTAIDAGFKYKQPGESIDVMVTYANAGRDSILSYELEARLDNEQPIAVSHADTVTSGRSNTSVFPFLLPADITVGTHQLSVSISKVNGEPLDARSKNDTVTATFAVYNDMVRRDKVYLEVYTDQTSPYVPFLNKSIAQLLRANNALTVVNVHRPSTPLALASAAYLHELYAYTWPTFTINRSYFPGEAYVSYDMNDYLTAVPTDMISNILGEMLMQDYYSPAFATVALQSSYEEATRQLTIEASGLLLPEAEAIYGQLALTLMLTEDSVQSRQAEYNALTQRSSYNQKYQHNQVLRTFVTSPIGDAIQAEDGKYSVVYTTTLAADWNVRHTNVVALLTKKVDAVTDSNLLDVDVINANSLALGETLQLGISQPFADRGQQSSCFYTLDGKRVDASHMKSGLYIERRADGTIRKVCYSNSR